MTRPAILDEIEKGLVMGDLVQRLRGRAAWYRDAHPEAVKTPQLLLEAADYISSKEAEVEALEAERDQWDRRVMYDELKAREYENRVTQQRHIDAATLRAEKAEAEATRLRQLLRDVCLILGWPNPLD